MSTTQTTTAPSDANDPSDTPQGPHPPISIPREYTLDTHAMDKPPAQVTFAPISSVPLKPSSTSSSTSNWISAYEKFLLQNAGRIASFESTVRSFSYLVTGQVQEVEVASETLYSVLQILGMYHDRVIAKATKPLLKMDPGYRPSNHNRYTQSNMKRSKAYRRIVHFLSVLRCTELLWEMVARSRFQERGRWMAILAIEFIKATCRLGLLVSTNRRPLVSPPAPEREVDPNRIVCDDHGSLSLLPPTAGSPNQDLNSMDLAQKQELILAHEDSAWRMPRSGKGLPKNPESGIDQFLAQKVLAAEDVRAPEHLLHQLSRRGLAAEVLYILRPLVYAALAYRYRHHRRNWTPWLAGLLLEYASRRLSLAAYKSTLPGGFRSLTALEDAELKSRATAFGWWAMRGAMYENWTRPVLGGALAKVSKVPLAGTLFGAIVEDYMYLFDNYHFPASTL